MSSSSHVHFKLGIICALVRAELPLAVVAERLLGLDGVPGGVGLECPGDSRDVGHLGGRVSQRGRPTLQQELSVVDDPGASWRGAEHRPSGSGGVLLGHVGRVVHGDPADGRDVAAPATLAPR